MDFKCPEQICIDPLHMVYEGVIKLLLNNMINPKNRCELFFIGRPTKFSAILQCLQNISVPAGFSKIPLLQNLSFWTADDFRQFGLHILFPIIGSNVPIKFSVHIAALVHAIQLANFNQITPNICYQVDVLIKFFLQELINLYPKEMNTINMHLLSHISNQVQLNGPLWAASMFAFESSMKFYKKCIQGTRGHLHQIAKKVIVSHVLKLYLHFASLKRNHIINLANSLDISLEEPISAGHLIDSYRYLNEGICYHSISYPFKKSSQNSICFTKSNVFGKIVSFRNIGNKIIVNLNVYHVVCSVLELFVDSATEPLSYNYRHIVSVMKNLNPIFVIVEETQELIKVDASELQSLCLMYDLNFNNITYKCLVKMSKVYLHK
jgi:hypothetical protein